MVVRKPVQPQVTLDLTFSTCLAVTKGRLTVRTTLCQFLTEFLVGDMRSFDVASAWWNTMHTSDMQNFVARGVSSAYTFPGLKKGHACVISPYDNQFYLFGGLYTCMSVFCRVFVISERKNSMWRFHFITI